MSTTQQQNPDTLAAICEAFWDNQLRFSPIEGLGHGREDAKIAFFRESLDDLKTRDGIRHQLADRLQRLDASGLVGQDVISYQMLQRQTALDLTLVQLDDDLRPNMFPFGVEAALNYAAAGTVPANTQAALEFVERLSGVPAALEAFAERFQTGAEKGYRLPSQLLERVLSNVSAAFSTPVGHSPLLSPLTASRFEKERELAIDVLERKVYPALTKYRDDLDRIYSKASRETIGLMDEKDGEAYYAAQIARHTSLQLPPAEIHRLGIAELDRIQSELSDVARQTGHADVTALRAFMDGNPEFQLASDVELLERIQVLSKRIDGLIPAFFSNVPRSTYEVRSIPAAVSANSPPAYAQPAPADRSAPGIHWVTSLPERSPTYMHVPLALHEAWPGHLMHIALLEEVEGIPSFRKFGALQHNAYIEGWALYCEGLGVDMGLYDGPYAHFGRLSMDAWRAARLVVDTGIHAMGWKRDQAVTFLEQHQAMGRAAAEAEIDRYIGMPAQALSYKLGHIAIRQLRAEAEKAHGSQFSIRELHHQLINCGAVPLTVLEKHVRSWISSKANA